MKLSEKQLINKLVELENQWPDNYWLFSASGTLCLMKKKDGKRAMNARGGVDQERVVWSSLKIQNDGGDW